MSSLEHGTARQDGPLHNRIDHGVVPSGRYVTCLRGPPPDRSVRHPPLQRQSRAAALAVEPSRGFSRGAEPQLQPWNYCYGPG